MRDLYFAAGIVGLASILMLMAGMYLGRRRSVWPAIVALLAAGVFYGLYFQFFRDDVRLVQLINLSAVPIAGDPTPWLAAFVAGVLIAQRRVPVLRRSVVAAVIISLGWHGPISIVTRTPPGTHSSGTQGVYLQTSASTCGPAALVTLLKRHGVKTNETEMADLCLTNDQGTHLTGLYRGLTLKAPAGTRARAVHLTVDELIATPDRLPAVASLMLTQALADTDPRYTEDWGWDVGVMHTVVVLRVVPGERVLIGDPGVGPELWHLQGLRDFWTGEVLYLERDE